MYIPVSIRFLDFDFDFDLGLRYSFSNLGDLSFTFLFIPELSILLHCCNHCITASLPISTPQTSELLALLNFYATPTWNWALGQSFLFFHFHFHFPPSLFYFPTYVVREAFRRPWTFLLTRPDLCIISFVHRPPNLGRDRTGSISSCMIFLFKPSTKTWWGLWKLHLGTGSSGLYQTEV